MMYICIQNPYLNNGQSFPDLHILNERDYWMIEFQWVFDLNKETGWHFYNYLRVEV